MIEENPTSLNISEGDKNGLALCQSPYERLKYQLQPLLSLERIPSIFIANQCERKDNVLQDRNGFLDGVTEPAGRNTCLYNRPQFNSGLTSVGRARAFSSRTTVTRGLWICGLRSHQIRMWLSFVRILVGCYFRTITNLTPSF